MTGNDVRRLFLEFFQNHQHSVIKSSSLVPQNDPTLLFTNAGMVQFKRIFLGEENRGYSRAVTSQKCVRAGGKHNDLENVGYTARHHTFFEMLGNFSFGDYFKEQAIEFAWKLLTEGYRLNKDQLWVSVYLDDDDAYAIWKNKIGIPSNRLVRLGEKDNFWAMGDTGPCGPCSEIHFDRGKAFSCDNPNCSIDCECDRFLEIWNLVFMQYNRDALGKLSPLPKPSIDTGMGLERIASVIQNVRTNYETDLFVPIIQKIQDISEKPYGQNPTWDVAMKVIADHSRSASFLIGDGVLPSNEGRGYVLRRILRRAIRYGRNIGLKQPFLHQIAISVIQNMADAYPEFIENKPFISNVIINEEQRFIETLDNGMTILTDALNDLKTAGKSTIPGDLIFKLYDTYGFPVDIIQDVIRDDKTFQIDMDGFNKAMKHQREQSRSTVSFSGIGDAYTPLTSQGVKSEFVGYTSLTCESEVLLLVKDKNAVNLAVQGDVIDIVTTKTPFYGESGGQMGDAGMIQSSQAMINVTDTKKDPTGLIIHQGIVQSGTLKKGDKITLQVDKTKRHETALNHTATHILHAVLKQVLGDHVKQSGSMVSSERLRFDFTHFTQVTEDQLLDIEKLVNERIRLNDNLTIHEMNIDEAVKSGATALFEEKYGDRVRVISIADFSKELCGGTHTQRTGNIGLFRILAESSVAAGIRRIEALTGHHALLYSQEQTQLVKQVSLQLKEKPEKLIEKIEKNINRQKAFEKELTALKAKLATMTTDKKEDIIQVVNGIKVIRQKVEIDQPAALRDLMDQYKSKIQSGIVILGSSVQEKVLLICGVTKDLTKQFHAGQIVKKAAEIVGGSGGGRPDMAQAGGTLVDKVDEALDTIFSFLNKTKE